MIQTSSEGGVSLTAVCTSATAFRKTFPEFWNTLRSRARTFYLSAAASFYTVRYVHKRYRHMNWTLVRQSTVSSQRIGTVCSYERTKQATMERLVRRGRG
jgi:hypothetical protein